MDISSLTGTNNVAGVTRAQDHRSKRRAFKASIAQLSNQDPMAPQDEYVQQFTQFSMLEQMMNLNKGVEGYRSVNRNNTKRPFARWTKRCGKVMRWDEELGFPVKYRLQDDAGR